MPYYAHIRQDENGQTIYQTVAEHLTGTAALCREFAADFGAEADGDLMGLAHDLGKCTDAFQKRLLEGGPVVDHTMAGMLTCIKMKRPSAAACAAGHHGGLLDVGNLRTDRAGEATLSGRFKKGVEGHYLERCGESGVTLPTLPPETPERNPLKASFRTRMLYSCLVDADFLDTERFMDGERGRGGYDDLPTLLRRLNEYIAPWQNPKTALNKLRCKILNSCLDKGSKPKGIYTLTVPTGGGKTVASLAFALRHAVAHGMKRVIYVVPYTSIIEQNAEVFREILGDGNVLEHHSGVQFELSDGASPEEVRRALAAENWDMPVIVTTAVQFFESIYANRSSKCRKLHNLADSVIIFDEAQMLPLCHLRPCVAAMASLAEQFRSTLVLCTATQPSLDDLLHTYAPSCPITELCPQTAEEYDSFRRVTFRQEGILEDDALAEKLSEHRQVLCIVNSRKAAQSIFARLPQEAAKEDADHYHIYIKDGVPLNTSDEKACAYVGLTSDKLKEAKKKDKHLDEKIRDFMCSNFYDIRTFGAVMTTFTKGALNCGQVRGPVQLGFARSIDPILPQEVTITRVAITTEADAEKKNTEMGRKYIVPYGLYRAEGYVSANLARKTTGFSEEDLELLWTAILNMFENDHSAARGKMAVRELIVFKHNCELGCAPAHKLFDLVKVEHKDGVTAPRSYGDYTVSVDETHLPSGVTCTRMG